MALSGGGHRASLFAAGALLGLVDASVQTRVVSISSVSGGSITNGIVAASGDLQGMDRAALEAALRPGIEVFARQGLFFPGQVTDRYVQVTLALCAAAAGAAAAVVIHGVWWVAVAAAVLAVAVIGRLVATRTLPVLTGIGDEKLTIPRGDHLLEVSILTAAMEFVIAILLAITGNWQATTRQTINATFATIGAGDLRRTNDSRNTEFDLQWNYRLTRENENKFKKVQMIYFLRYSNRFARTRNFAEDVINLTKLNTFNTGLNFIFF